MCSKIITTRLPSVRFLAGLRIGNESATGLSCRYLTCGSLYRFQFDRDHVNNSSIKSKYFRSANLSKQLAFGSCYSTINKDDALRKGIIPEVALRKQERGPAAADAKPIDEADDDINAKKLGLFQRFKLMYKQYWYVLIPVHVITSIGWFGGFYYLSQSGVDIPALLQSLSVSETVIDRLRDSTMGHVAIAYLCYKIATPIRYMVTLGGTTVSIKYLEQYGYIKPMPSKSQLMQMYEDKKADRARRKQERSNDEQ